MRIVRTLTTAATTASIAWIMLLGAASKSMALDIGDQAPDFNLTATTGGKISLSEFRGKKIVLLEFYGADFAPV